MSRRNPQPNVRPRLAALSPCVPRCKVTTTAVTGVEMEALVAVSVAALTLYDMLKAADKGIEIREIVLERKSGGKGGEYRRAK